jgi:hypothetical protein
MNSHILFLKNIFMHDFTQPEDLLEERMLEECIVAENRQHGTVEHDPLNLDEPAFMTVPTSFTTVRAWPAKVGLACWSCTLVPLGRPVAIPTAANAAEMQTMGLFCSWPCAKRWLDITYNRNDIGSGWADKDNFLRLFYKEFTKPMELIDQSPKSSARIIIGPAPSPYIMAKFCGPGGLSEEDYRKKIAECTANILQDGFK